MADGSTYKEAVDNIEVVIQEWIEAAKDLDALMAFFWDSPDLIVVLFGNLLRGEEAVRASIAQMFKHNESIKVTILESRSVPVGDAVMTVGTATYDLKPKNGTSSTDRRGLDGPHTKDRRPLGLCAGPRNDDT